MSDGASALYWDSSVFLHFIAGSPEHLPLLSQILDAPPAGDAAPVVTSTLTLTEVAFGVELPAGGVLEASIIEAIDALWDDTAVGLLELTRSTAIDARELMRRARQDGRGLKPADAIHLASARHPGVAEFHTFDRRLFQYGAWLGFSICPPRWPLAADGASPLL